MGNKGTQLWLIIENEVRSQIAHNELLGASTLLLEVTDVFAKSILNEAVIISNGVNSLQRLKCSGVLNYSQAMEEENKIALRMLEFLARIEQLYK